jgi:hypothetical protein
MSQPNKLPWHERALEAERILMVDLTATRAQVTGVAPSANRNGGQTETTVATPLNVLLPPSTVSVDLVQRQLTAIHTIAIVQLAECVGWRWTNLTSSPIHAWASWQKHVVEPSAARVAPLPPPNFSPLALPWQWD